VRLADENIELVIIRTLLGNSKIRVKGLGRLTTEYFGSNAALEIFRRILSLLQQDKPIPSIELLRIDQTLTEAARAWLFTDVKPLETEDDFENAFKTLDYYRKGRVLLKVMTYAAENLREDNPRVDEIASRMENALMKCHSAAEKEEMLHICAPNEESLMKILDKTLDEIDDSYIPSGFAEYDKKTGGFRRGQMIAIASVPGGGKSAMAAQMAMNQYMMGYRVLFVSLEMGEDEVMNRMFSSISKVEHGEINLKKTNAKQKKHIREKFKDFVQSSKDGNNRLTIWRPTREMTIPEMAMEVKAMAYDVIYIDYLSLLKNDGKAQLHEILGQHARQAKLAAVSLNAVLTVLVQYDDESNKIKYSKAIVANADAVWAWDNTLKEQESGLTEIKQLKARNAGTYPFYLQKDMKVMTFADYTGPAPETLKAQDEKEKKEEKKPRKNLPKMSEIMG